MVVIIETELLSMSYFLQRLVLASKHFIFYPSIIRNTLLNWAVVSISYICIMLYIPVSLSFSKPHHLSSKGLRGLHFFSTCLIAITGTQKLVELLGIWPFLSLLSVLQFSWHLSHQRILMDLSVCLLFSCQYGFLSCDSYSTDTLLLELTLHGLVVLCF